MEEMNIRGLKFCNGQLKVCPGRLKSLNSGQEMTSKVKVKQILKQWHRSKISCFVSLLCNSGQKNIGWWPSHLGRSSACSWSLQSLDKLCWPSSVECYLPRWTHPVNCHVACTVPYAHPLCSPTPELLDCNCNLALNDHPIPLSKFSILMKIYLTLAIYRMNYFGSWFQRYQPIEHWLHWVTPEMKLKLLASRSVRRKKLLTSWSQEAEGEWKT